MSNNFRKRSNSVHSNSINNQRRGLDFIINENNSSEECLNKSTLIPIQKKEMVSVKQLQNIELATYDYIFVGRHFLNTTIQDFESFINQLKSIKNKLNPSLFKVNKNIEKIKKEGKFSISNSNITNLVMLNKKDEEAEISINTSYIKILKSKKSFKFYTTKSILKGKHCFELEIMNMSEPIINYGLINISQLALLKKVFKASSNNLEHLNINIELLNYFKLNNPIFYHENGKNYNHFITYGDILGLCFDLDQKIIYIYINGTLRGTHLLTIKIGENCAFVPIISFGANTEIIFNPGHNLKYLHNYNIGGFIPLDEEGENNYEKSHMINVTNEYIDILINIGMPIIMNKNISNSDINQIFHIIFDSLANISFKHSYIIKNSLIENFIGKYSKEKLDDKELEFYYICLKYILNYSKTPKLILKNLFLNLSETIHIFMRRGVTRNINLIKVILKLFTFLFTKKEIMDTFGKMKITTTKIFKAIFVSFHVDSPSYENNFLDFEITNDDFSNINNSPNKNIINKINPYFPKLIHDSIDFKKAISSMKNDLKNISSDLLTLFNELIIILFTNGTDTENKKIFNIFKTFLKKEIENIFKAGPSKGQCQFNNIFKNIFLPAMNLFNEQYEKVYKNSGNSLSIKKYLNQKETDGEKIGGTIKYIFEEFPKKILNFQELLSYTIKDYNNIFFLEFIYIFFIDRNSSKIWGMLTNIIKKNIELANLGFLKEKSFEAAHNSLVDYINCKLYEFNSNNLKIVLQFLLNFSDIIIGLYSTELIYFLPEKIFIKIWHIIELLNEINNLLDKSDNNNNNLIPSVVLFDGGSKKELKKLREKSLKKYISIIIELIKDKNIKKLIIKCDYIDNIQNYIALEEYFTDEYLLSIFDFIYLIHNNNEYKEYANNFMIIFETKLYDKQSKYYNFGERLAKLLKTNQNFLRILIIILYSNINSSLTRLEERFCEYKSQPGSIQNNNNSNNEQNNNLNANLSNLLDTIYILFDNNNMLVRNRFRAIRRVNFGAMTASEQLKLLEDSFKDTIRQFLRLNAFYKITKDIDELYDINSFENKNLRNLLLSLYSIVFSPKNIEKIIDEKTKKINGVYKKLLSKISSFYKTIIEKILEQKNDTFLKELSKHRNIYHFGDIFKIFEKYNAPISSILNEFLSKMEKIITEEELLKLSKEFDDKNNIEVTKSGNKIEKNICFLCADSVMDIHLLPCEHSICKNCLLHYLSESKEKKLCPFCRAEIKGIKEDPNFKV